MDGSVKPWILYIIEGIQTLGPYKAEAFGDNAYKKGRACTAMLKNKIPQNCIGANQDKNGQWKNKKCGGGDRVVMDVRK